MFIEIFQKFHEIVSVVKFTAGFTGDKDQLCLLGFYILQLVFEFVEIVGVV
jgi:hypothetical protein